MAIKGYSAFPKAPALLEPHHQIVSCHNQDTPWGRGVLPICREAGSVFYSPSRLGNQIIQISISTQFKYKNSKLLKPLFSSILQLIVTLIMFYHSEPEWTWEQWQWRVALHSPKLQHYWNLTIRLFHVISRTPSLGRSYSSVGMQSVYSKPHRLISNV